MVALLVKSSKNVCVLNPAACAAAGSARAEPVINDFPNTAGRLDDNCLETPIGMLVAVHAGLIRRGNPRTPYPELENLALEKIIKLVVPNLHRIAAVENAGPVGAGRLRAVDIENRRRVVGHRLHRMDRAGRRRSGKSTPGIKLDPGRVGKPEIGTAHRAIILHEPRSGPRLKTGARPPAPHPHHLPQPDPSAPP